MFAIGRSSQDGRQSLDALLLGRVPDTGKSCTMSSLSLRIRLFEGLEILHDILNLLLR